MLSISLFFPFIQNNLDISYEENRDVDFIKPSAQRSVTTQWINNPTFESPIEPTWEWKNGTEGDNSDMDATTSTGQANYNVLGETRTFTVVSGIINSSTSPDWVQFRNGDFQYPDTSEIRSYGAYVSHEWADDTNQAPSVHWKTNISIPIDMSDYVITSASLEVIVNASVSANVDTPNDEEDGVTKLPPDYWQNFAIGDSVTYYAQISDLGYNPPLFTVASNKTKSLGQNDPQNLTISDSPLETVGEIDLKTALNSAFDKDPSHSNFTLTLGIDIYSEDNLPSTDWDTFNDLIIKTCNLTFTVKKKIDQFTTLSWNQEGNTLDSGTVQVTDAKFFFKYKINNTWPSSAPLSEIIFSINDKSYDEGIIKLTSATTSWQDAKVGGFDVTSLISTGVNIAVSIEVFLKDSFELGEGYSISIDEVYLNISYIETFPDYGTDLELFLDGEDKTLDPVIQIPIKDMLNITVYYKDNVSGNHISADSATLEGKVSGDLTENVTLEHYYFIVNSTDLSLGISVLTVTLQKNNYETESIQIFVEVIERETELHLFIDEIQRSNKDTINTKFNKLLNVTIFYEDNLTSAYISGATVSLLGYGTLNETLSQYNFTLDTNRLIEGVNVLTIFAQKDDFQSNTIKFYINVVERASNITLFVESEQKYDSDSITSQFNEFLNLTIYYRDNLTNKLISNASVNLLGFGDLNETSNHYYFILDTNNLTQGVNILTIFAQKDNYQYQAIKLFVNIQVRTTYIKVFVEGSEKNDSDTINTQFGEFLNITILYQDNVTDAHLTGSSVDLIGFGSFSEIGTQFNFTINTNNFENGLNILTIFAQLNGYQDQTFQILLDIYDRETELLLFINSSQRYDAETINSQYGELLNITILYRDNVTKQHITTATVNMLGLGIFDELLNQNNFTLNTDDLSQGINVLTILCSMDSFQSQTIQFVINIQERDTYLRLFIEELEIFDSDTFDSQFDELLNITILYRDFATDTHLMGASVDLLGFGNFSESGSQFNFTLYTNALAEGINALTIILIKDNYQTKTIQFFINIQERSTYIRLFVEEIERFNLDTIDTQFDEFLNITILYRDLVTDAHLTGASVDLLGFGNFTELGAQFNFVLYTNALAEGINALTIISIKDKYQSKTIQFFINVQERTTYLQLFVEEIERFDLDTIDSQFDELLNITILYRDLATDAHLTGANVDLLGFGNFTEIGTQFNFVLDTNLLAEGINALTIISIKDKYQSKTIQFFINVQERTTYLQLFVEEIERFDLDTIDSQFDELLNITILYRDLATDAHLTGANVDLLSFGNFSESGTQFNLVLDTKTLAEGINALTILSIKNNYQSKTIEFFINVQERATYIQIFVEDIEIFDLDTFDTQFDEILNITILYRDFSTDAHLTGASVDLLGFGNFTEIGTQFNYTINTNILENGINILTIFSQFGGYKTQRIQFFINVEERNTNLFLYINSLLKSQGESIKFEANEWINISVYYEDDLTKNSLNGANIELLGFGVLNQTGMYYNITINSNSLEKGINVLTLFAQLSNYQAISVQFIIEVVDRATQLQLLLNGVDVTLDPVFEIPIESLINITVKYLDNQTGIGIPNALLQLIGEDLHQNLTELLSNQYSIIINTSILLIGVKLFTIVASAPNFQINTIDLRIKVNRVNTSLDTVSGLNFVDISPNEDFLIQIILDNNDYGGTIKNATVTYWWDNGQGILIDSNNDGIYEAILNNVPAGSYRISINAYAGENYDFRDDFEIVLNVIAPPGLDITIIIISLTAGIVGLSVGFILYQTHFKYPPKVRMMRKIRKKISKGKKLKPLIVNTRDNIIASEIERNKDILIIEKEIEDKIIKKNGGDSLE